MSCIEVQQQDFRVCIQPTVQTTAVNFSEVLSFSVSGLIKTNWDWPQLLQLVQQGHSETPSLSQLLVFSTQPLHELFQKIGFLHVPLDRLFLQIQSSPKEKVFIYTWTLTNSEKCLQIYLRGKKKKDIKKVPYLINLTSLTVKCSLYAALAQCTLTMLHFKKAFSRKTHYPSISIPFSVWSKQYQQLQTAYCSSYNCLLCFDRHLWKLLGSI